MKELLFGIGEMPIDIPYPDQGTGKLRRGRFSERSQVYHVSTATNERERVFETFQFARIVIRSLRLEDVAQHTRTLAFVVMPDHLHWLFQLKGDRALSRCVNNVKSFATRKINGVSGRQGRMWQKGFYDRAIRREADLVGIARYIVANPLRAGLVRSVREYPHWDANWL